MKTEKNELLEALMEIANPIKFMQDRLKDGEKLDGMYAVMLDKDPNYLKEIARRAIANYLEPINQTEE